MIKSIRLAHQNSISVRCAVAPPPRRKPPTGGGGNDKNNSGGGNNNENSKNNSLPAYKIIALNKSIYYSSNLTSQCLVHKLNERFKKVCKTVLIEVNGFITLRIYTHESVVLPQGFSQFDDICHKLNQWNLATYTLDMIEIAEPSWLLGVCDINLSVPIEGDRLTCEFKNNVDISNDINGLNQDC